MFAWLLAAGSAEAGNLVIINELDADQVGIDAAEFVELYDGGAGNTSLTGLVVVFYNGSNDLSYAAFDLGGFSTDASGFFVLGNAAVPNVDLVFQSNILQNGQDAVALYQANASAFPNNTPVTTTNLIDALVYDTSDLDDAGLLTLLNPGQPQIDEDGGGNGTGQSVGRCPNGSGGQRNTTTYANLAPTSGAANTCPAVITLALSFLPTSFSESAGANAATGTVTRMNDPNITNALTVTLTNPDTSEITIPAMVTIPANQTSTTFMVNAVDDALMDGTQTVTVGATASGSLDISASVMVNDDDVLISTIQGDVSVLASPANLSLLDNQRVSIRGVVTNLASNGFYLQEETADGDGNNNTSEGIFVFTSSAPTVVLGNIALVTGTVDEFTLGGAGSGNLSVTQIIAPTVTVTGTIADAGAPGIDIADLGNAVVIRTLTTLPDRLVFNPFGVPDDPNTGIEFFETIEGALVRVNAGTVVGPTRQFGTMKEFAVVAPGNAVAGSGYFSTTHNLIIQSFNAAYTDPASPPSIGGGDFNPERIVVGNKGGLIPAPEVAADGTIVSNIVGTISYDFGAHKIQPVFALNNVVPGAQSDPLTPQGANVGITTLNVDNLFDTINEPGRADNPILTAAELDTKLTKLTLAITQQLALPDILVIQQVENQAIAQQLADRVNTATGTTNYRVRSLDAADDRSVEVGFIYNANRVSLLSAFNPALLLTPPNVVGDDQHTRSTPVGPFADANLGTAFIADTNRIFEGGPGATFADAREPLVGVFHFEGQNVLVIGLHLTTKGGDGPLFGVIQPPLRPSEAQRRQQATYVRQLVDLFFNGDPARAIPAFTHILVAGDVNDFQFPEQDEVGNDAVSVMQGLGVPANRFLYNLVNDVPADQRYSLVLDGNSQQLDHMLVSPALLSLRLGQDIAHFNADYPDSLGSIATTPVRSANRDPLAGTFALVPNIGGLIFANGFE